MPKLDLDVPFSEKDAAKALGARWDGERKTWYIPESIPSSGFEKWLPFRNICSPYWYIAQTKGTCWNCNEATLLTSILLPESHQTLEAGQNENETFWLTRDKPAFIFYIYDIPHDNLLSLQKINHYLSKDFSKTTQSKYWMNHCQHCSSKQGDFQMHCEPDGYFCRLDPNEAKEISLYTINQSFTASCGDISHDHIHLHFHNSDAHTAGEMIQYMNKIK